MPGRPRRILAAVLVALALAACAAALVRHRLRAAEPQAVNHRQVPAPRGTRRIPAGRVRIRSPHPRLTGLRWADFDGVLLPESASAGPRRTRHGLASGYADTPLGAVLAAVNIAVRATPQFGPAIFRPTISRQVTGPNARALLRACIAAYRPAAASAHVTGGRALGPAYVVEQAFRLVSWSGTEATIDIVSAGPGPGGVTARAATRIQVVRLRGDWRVVAPPNGDWAAAATVVRSMSGFTLLPLSSGG